MDQQLILGSFSSRSDAEKAITELENKGYSTKDISIMMKDSDEARSFAHDTNTSVSEGAVDGIKTGGIIGIIAGLLVGAGTVAIPGLGALLIGGPIATALGVSGVAGSAVSGGIAGALAGGVIGALIKLGVSEDDARQYETKLKEGAVLVAIPVKPSDNGVQEVLKNNHADQIGKVPLK